MIKLYKKNTSLVFEEGETSFYSDSAQIDVDKVSDTTVKITIWKKQGHDYKQIITRRVSISDIVDEEDNQYGTTYHDLVPHFDIGVDVSIQDQSTQAVIVKFNKVHTSTTLSVQATLGAYTFTVTDSTSIVTTNYFIVYNPQAERFSIFTVLGIAGNVVTVDTPIDYAYPIGSFVDVSTVNMNVNGSVTSQVFGIRGTTIPQDAVPIEFDVTRILFKCFAASSVDLSLFGNLTALTRGLVLRKRDGTYYNIFNVKNNGDLAGIMYDWTPYQSSNPVEGQDGFTARLTFGGQEKIGVVQRLAAGEDLECIVQDNLTGLIRLEIVAEGHIVKQI